MRDDQGLSTRNSAYDSCLIWNSNDNGSTLAVSFCIVRHTSPEKRLIYISQLPRARSASGTGCSCAGQSTYNLVSPQWQRKALASKGHIGASIARKYVSCIKCEIGDVHVLENFFASPNFEG
jgi:hypothetical protein